MTSISLALMFAAISNNLGLPPGLLASICEVESNNDPMAIHRDDNGSDSVGLCQLKLGTARMLGYEGLDGGLYQPAVNAYFAGLYLQRSLRRYGNDPTKAVSAYNAGHASRHNRLYVDKVMSNWGRRQ